MQLHKQPSLKSKLRGRNAKRWADILHVAFPFGAHADSWKRSKRSGTRANKYHRGRKISKALSISHGWGKNSNSGLSRQSRLAEPKSQRKKVTLTGFPQRNWLNSQVVQDRRLKIHAESPRTSERSFCQSHGHGQIKLEFRTCPSSQLKTLEGYIPKRKRNQK